MLHDDVAKDEIALERFKREYEINASLPHEHIVKVLDFQRDVISDSWILVMEFLDGEELRYVLKREKVLPPERLVRMLSQVAIGLDDAHARGFIHRDLKPDNLFLCGTREGDVVKLLDFGSVKDTEQQPQEADDARHDDRQPVLHGSRAGAGPRDDRSLAPTSSRSRAVVYECVTGEVPFGGTNGPSILLAILTKDPVPPTVKGVSAKYPIPPGIDDVLEVALAKNPAIRTKSVGALADAVGAAYGLTGDHRQWAIVPQQELAAQIEEAMPRLMATKVAALGEVADPFAAPGQWAAGGAPTQHDQGMAQAFAAVREADLAPSGVPMGKPGWLLPLIVGVLALLVGGAVTLVVMMGR